MFFNNNYYYLVNVMANFASVFVITGYMNNNLETQVIGTILEACNMYLSVFISQIFLDMVTGPELGLHLAGIMTLLNGTVCYLQLPLLSSNMTSMIYLSAGYTEMVYNSFTSVILYAKQH